MLGIVDCPPESKSARFDGLAYDDWTALLAIARRVDPDGMATLLKVAQAFSEIGPTGRKILGMLADRLAAGRRLYADDFDRKRNWPRETSEELADAVIYLLCGQIKASDGYGEK
jgi:hypothetical protein